MGQVYFNAGNCLFGCTHWPIICEAHTILFNQKIPIASIAKHAPLFAIHKPRHLKGLSIDQVCAQRQSQNKWEDLFSTLNSDIPLFQNPTAATAT